MILQTKYFDIETNTFLFKNPKAIREQLEETFKNCFTDKPSTNLAYECGPVDIILKYEPTKDFFSMPFPIDSNDIIFSNVGCIEGYKIMDDDYTCRKFHYEPNHSYTIEGDPFPCKRGFHFCKELADCFNYYQPTPYIDMSYNITYDLDVFKFFNVKSNGTTYQLRDKYCTNNITILNECSTEEILEAFKKWDGKWSANYLWIKLRDEYYEYHDGIFHKVIPGEKLDNQPTWYIYSEEN